MNKPAVSPVSHDITCVLKNSTFTVDVYTGNTVPATLLKQYGRLRYDCFAEDDPYVQMNREERTELDVFDNRPTTLHLMVCNTQRGKPELVSAVRLIPTLEDYDLEQSSWGYLTQELTLPKAGHIMEASRWVGKSSRSYEGALSTALLMLRLYQLSREQGFDQLLGVISAAGEKWLKRRHASQQPAAARYATERDGEILVTTLPLDQTFLDCSRTMMSQAMESWPAVVAQAAM